MTTPTLLHAARIVDAHGTYWFVSLDGELYVEVGADPRHATRAAVEQAHRPDAQGFRQIRLVRRYLQSRNAEFFDPTS